MSEHEQSSTIEMLDLIYDAALEPERWPSFLQALASRYPDGQGVLYGMHGQRASVLLANWDPAWTQAHNAHFYDTNPWLDGMRLRPAGVTNAAEDFVPTREFELGEYFNDFLRPQGLGTGVGATVLREGASMVGVSVLFSKVHGETATREDVDRLARLVPHLSRAAAVNRLVGEARFQRQAAEEALERLATGVMVTDAGGRVIFLNTSANRILAERDGLRLGPGSRVETQDPRQTEQFLSLVSDAALPAGKTKAASGGAMSLRRTSGSQDLKLLVTPLRMAADLLGFRDAAALVFVVDPTQRAASNAEILISLLGVTPAQARIASALAAGGNVRKIAADLRISEATVRFHLKETFARTETRGQGDLIRLVLTVTGGTFHL